MLNWPHLNPRSRTPLYRQLYEHIKGAIERGEMVRGERLPATRKLADMVGLNRTTITAAYELLESEGLIRSHVGQGSFVEGVPEVAEAPLVWQDLMIDEEPEALQAPVAGMAEEMISFATSRPSEELFPVEEIHTAAAEVLRERGGEILQLGSPTGYPPLRQYLLETARRLGAARECDEVIVTSGCQQALDLLRRVLIQPGDKVAVEDPVYPGIHHVLARAGAKLFGVPVSEAGMDVDRLEAVIEREQPKLVIVTPDFQNPTGATLPLEARQRLLRLARGAGIVVAENDIYSGLRYEGAELPSLKQLDKTGNVIQLRSFSKIAFPGLRVGWVLGPRPLIARLAEAKQWSDLHTDQLSQAVLWRFAESGRLEAHRKRVVAAGRQRLAATQAACARHLPCGTRFTRPQGGMSLWVSLPEPLDSAELLPKAQRENVTYLPGKYFSVSRPQPSGLRLSFAGLSVEKIERGIAILGRVFQTEADRVRGAGLFEPAPAMV